MESSEPIKEYENWGIDEVCNWLDKVVALPQYKSIFMDLAIDGSLLSHILDEDLQNDFQIKIRLHRIKIIEAIKKLNTECTKRVEEDLNRKDADDEYKDEERVRNTRNEGRITPDREDQSRHKTHFSKGSQKDGKNPSIEVIGHIDRSDPIENYIDDSEESSQMHEDQDEKLIIVLKVVEGQQLNNVYLIGEQGARLGRHSASNDIVISESFVSRKHCEISHQHGDFFLRDLGSTTGSFLMIRDKITLKEGMMFQMGLSEFKVSMLSKDMELHIFEGPSRNQTILVTPSGLKIGRDPANSFCVAEDTQMSNYHARILFDASNGTYILEDVGSTNRTWLRLSNEGEKSINHQLSMGDIIKIGSTVFLVQQIRKVSDSVNMPIINSNHRSVEIESNNRGNKNLIVALQEQEVELSNSSLNLCKICYSKTGNIALITCGHSNFCFDCSEKFHECPVCRAPIVDKIKIFGFIFTISSLNYNCYIQVAYQFLYIQY